MQISEEQALAFLRSLWPAGEQCNLHSHARTYFEALLGECPMHLYPYDAVSVARSKQMASILRQIADHLDNGAKGGQADA